MSSKVSPDLPKNLEAGTLIDERYEIVELLGSGGIAQVYRAIQLDLHREVALKIVAPNNSRRLRRMNEERLINEALTTARVQHPNIINIRALGRRLTMRTTAGPPTTIKRPYMVMDCLQGHTLAEHLFHFGPMTPSRALPLFLNILDALAVCHDQDIVHKDIKPDNIFVSNPDQPSEALVLLDFGIARGAETFTTDGAMPCTANYVAPEYLEEHIVTPAIDVYQSALVLIEALTGRPVVDHESVMERIGAHVSGQLNVCEEITLSALWPVLSVALQRDFRRRFQSARAFYQALRSIDPQGVDLDTAEDVLFGAEPDSMKTTQTVPDIRLARDGEP